MQRIMGREIWDARRKSRSTEIAPVVASVPLVHLKMWSNVSVCLLQRLHLRSWLGVRLCSSELVAHWRKESLTAEYCCTSSGSNETLSDNEECKKLHK